MLQKIPEVKKQGVTTFFVSGIKQVKATVRIFQFVLTLAPP